MQDAWGRRLISAVLIVGALASSARPGVGAELIAIDFPPYVMQKAADPGFVVAFMNEASAKIAENVHISIEPIARALLASQRPVPSFVFPISRRPERETEFVWVAKLLTMDVGFVTRGAPIDDLAAARGLNRVAATQNSSWLKALVEEGFTNLDPGPHIDSNVRRLLAGRVDAFFNPFDEVRHVHREIGGTVQLTYGATIRSIDFWLAATASVDPTLVARYRTVVEAMVQAGRMKQLQALQQRQTATTGG